MYCIYLIISDEILDEMLIGQMGEKSVKQWKTSKLHMFICLRRAYSSETETQRVLWTQTNSKFGHFLKEGLLTDF